MKSPLAPLGRAIFVMAIRRGAHTDFKYGSSLKELRKFVKDNQQFTYARFDKYRDEKAFYRHGRLVTTANTRYLKRSKP